MKEDESHLILMTFIGGWLLFGGVFDHRIGWCFVGGVWGSMVGVLHICKTHRNSEKQSCIIE